MSEPYLILHKVRGQPAFDIAILCEDMGTETDPGPWWIVPTSGHRAYPYWSGHLITIDYLGKVSLEIPPGIMKMKLPDDWPDHCQHSLDRTPKSPISSPDVQAALAALIKPQAPIVRRKL